MRAVIIGAGRGSRLQHQTATIPKTLVECMGRPMLDWILDALTAGGIERRDIVFICGYAEHAVRDRYPDLTFVRNEDWPNNNILASLMCARDLLREGFVSTYADIVYEDAIVSQLLDHSGDLVLGCDTHWRRRYVDRSQHPETDAEKLTATAGQVERLSRTIPSDAATGEFIGVMKASPEGARAMMDAFDYRRSEFGGTTWREGRTFEKAYLIDLLQDMIEGGAVMHHTDTPGGYMELDTLEDLSLAEGWWSSRP